MRSKSSTADEVKRLGLWLLDDDLGPWRGEAFLNVAAVSRPLVSSFLAAHFRRRLSVLRRFIVLSEPPEVAAPLLHDIDDALSLWKARRAISGVLTALLSVAGVVGGITIIHVFEKMHWYAWLAIGLLVYLGYLFVVGSFIAKRGLMLGRSAQLAYRPGSIRGSGTYGAERDLFALLTIRRPEIPLDLVLSSLFIALLASVFFAVNLPVFGAILLAAIAVNVVSFVRRRQLQRL